MVEFEEFERNYKSLEGATKGGSSLHTTDGGGLMRHLFQLNFTLDGKGALMIESTYKLGKAQADTRVGACSHIQIRIFMDAQRMHRRFPMQGPTD